jgi:hypothetical protein
MRLVIALCVGLLLTGCAGSMANKSIDSPWDWSALVKPQDPVPSECALAPKPMPVVADGKKTGKDAAREYRKLQLAARDLERRYRRCRIWARAQR